MQVFGAFNSTPDYGGVTTLKSLHYTFSGAAKAIYPDREPKDTFIPSAYSDTTWNGPDGFGQIRQLTILP